MIEKLMAWLTPWENKALLAALGLCLVLISGFWITLKLQAAENKNLKMQSAFFEAAADQNLRSYNEAKEIFAAQATLMAKQQAAAVKRAASLSTQLERIKHDQDAPAAPVLINTFDWMRLPRKGGAVRHH